jgi:hypothetical protein
MQRLGGYFKCKTGWNCIGTIAQMLLRSKPFATAISTAPDLAADSHLISVFSDLYAQLHAQEPRLRIDPLIHSALGMQPPSVPVDIIPHLESLLYEMDAASSSFRGNLFSATATDSFPVLKWEPGPSFQSSFDTFVTSKLGGISSSLSQVVFIDATSAGSSEIPDTLRASATTRTLFAVISEVRLANYALFLRDVHGWLCIQDEEIVPVSAAEVSHLCLLGYIDDLRSVEGFRYSLAFSAAEKQ